jgi:putative NADPH-quinone reductase
MSAPSRAATSPRWSRPEPVRVLYVYCHPLAESFHGALLRAALAGLARRGHEVDLLDLYAERFDPVLGAEERRAYYDLARNAARVAPYVERLRQAQALVVQFPTWSFGPPAILKGFFDRVLIPGVAFDLSEPARVRPLLRHVRALVGIVTYGQPRLAAWRMGDPPRRLVTRYLRWFVASRARIVFHPLYRMNTAGEERRRAFLAAVGRSMERL